MIQRIEKRPHKLAYDLFKRVDNGDFEYIYRGVFTQTLTRKILGLAESNLQKFVDKSSLQNRIYFIMVEGLQNVTRHQDEVFDQTNDNSGIFAIQKLEDKYLITTGNLIVNSKVDSLKEKLDEVNSLDRDELKKLHKDILSTGELSDKGGAGLGLIEMARRSGNKLLFDFEYVDLYWSYFYLQTEIPSRSENDFEIKNASLTDTMRDIKYLNSLLSKRDILLSFNGNFNQNNILSLLSIIKGQMSLNKAAKKVYYIMVEMLQNISKHGKNLGSPEEGASGIFFLGQNEEEFILTAGNYIENHDVEGFRNRLDAVNELDAGDLNEYFNKILLDQNVIDPKKTGLGFIDMRLKCNGKLEFDFRRINDEYSFYTIQSTVKI
ncbi:MAG: SiaB family protein kinase [Bacteroidales bacterium]|nr:SiaB family protein kinase [Bacteroidales bacterium]MBN2756207.1 SiaB family protein kinase [Bacteroidales bacterium]